MIAVEEEFNIEFSDKDADEILSGRVAADKVMMRSGEGCNILVFWDRFFFSSFD